MFLYPRNRRYAIILVGLILVTSSVSCAFQGSSTPAGTQPAPLASPAMTSVQMATNTPEATDPDLKASTISIATSTPEKRIPTPSAVRTAISSAGDNPVENPQVDAQPAIDRTPTRLVIPAGRLDAPVEPVGWHVETQNGRPTSVWDAPDHFAAGWLKSTAPLGVPGNTVLDGHNNIKGEVFRNLINLRVGDIITLYSASALRVYRVDQKLILAEAGQTMKVRQTNAQYINPTADERLTLVTCWPPTSNTYRLIIIARPVS